MSATDSPFLRACGRQPVERVPVWFMRQAGRSLPEYRALRGDGGILDVLARPGLAAELTLQPVRRYGVDAAILFSDIVAPIAAIGFGVEVEAGRGPVAERPFRSASDLERLRPIDPAVDLAAMLETVALVVDRLDTFGVPLIGFAGAPFTVASYLIEGAPSRDYRRTLTMMRGEPDLFATLLDRLADLALATLRAQIGAGAGAVQLFDSWVGVLSRADYERHALPASRKILRGLADLSVPRIHFGVGAGELLPLLRDAGADVVGVDWRVPIDEARRRLGPETAVQGNLDPTACFAPPAVVAAEVERILAGGGGVGHVFNLGHGVLPETDPVVLGRIVELVHAWRPAG